MSDTESLYEPASPSLDLLTDDSEIEDESYLPPRKRRRSSFNSDVDDRSAIPPAFEAFLKRRPAESVDSFLARARPTTTPSSRGSWIYARSPVGDNLTSDNNTFDTYGEEKAAIFEGRVLLQEFEQQLQNSRRPSLPASLPASPFVFGATTVDPSSATPMLTASVVESKLYAIAEKHRYVLGKWLLFPSPRTVDIVWEKVARATFEGRLGMSAKVATNQGTGRDFVVCVYCRDFSDKEDVGRVLRVLRDDIALAPVAFKADFFTTLGVYSDPNPWGLRTTKYTVRDFPARRAPGRGYKAPIEDFFKLRGGVGTWPVAGIEPIAVATPAETQIGHDAAETMMDEDSVDSPVLNEIHHNTTAENARAGPATPQAGFFFGGPQSFASASLPVGGKQAQRGGAARRAAGRGERVVGGAGRRTLAGRTQQQILYRDEIDPWDF